MTKCSSLTRYHYDMSQRQRSKVQSREVRVVGVLSNVWWQKHTDWGNAFNIRKYNFSKCDSWKFIPLHTTFHQSIHVFNKHISVPSVCWNKCVNCSNVTDTKISQWEFHSIPKDGYHGSNRDLQFIFIFNFIFYQDFYKDSLKVFSGPALNPDKCELIVFVGWRTTKPWQKWILCQEEVCIFFPSHILSLVSFRFVFWKYRCKTWILR